MNSFPWEEAYVTAKELHERLAPFVKRIKAVGSLRRRKPRVRDLEFVAEPLMKTDLTGITYPEIDLIRNEFRKQGRWVKGAARMMQITNTLRVRGLRTELYLVHPPSQWGSLVAIRTGPAALSALAVTWMRARGYPHRHGHCIDVLKPGRPMFPTPTEKEFFEAAGMPLVPPSRREALFRSIDAGHGPEMIPRTKEAR